MIKKSIKSLFFIMLLVVSQVYSAKTTAKTKKAKTKTAKKAKANPVIVEIVKLYKARTYIKYKEAVIKLEKELSGKKKNSTLLSLLSQIYAHFSYKSWHFGNKDVDYIEEAYKNAVLAVKINKRNYMTFRALGNSFLIAGNRVEAVKALKTAIKLNPKDAESYYLLGCASEGSILNASSEAGKNFKKSLEINKGFLWALEDQIMASLKSKKIKEAQALFATLKEENPGHSDLNYYEASILLHAGKTEEARSKFKQYVSDNKGSSSAEYIRMYLDR